MDKIEKIKSEIERLYRESYDNAPTVLHQLMDFINSLPEEPVSKELEKETKKWWKEHLHLDPKNQLWMDAHQSIVFAKHFFELGMSVRNKAQKGEEV